MGSTWPLERYLDPEGYVTADSIRKLAEDACPEMARVLRPWVVTILLSDPETDDLTPEELEVWTRYQLADLADVSGVEDVPPEPLPSNSHPTLRGLEDWER